MRVPNDTSTKSASAKGGAPPAAAARGARARPRAVPATASAAAKRQAAAILEVLAGLRRPDGAASDLGISLPTYFKLEQRALDGLLTACEPRPQGRVPRPESRIAALEKQVSRLERECGRQQALVRAAQRTVGLTPLAAARSSEKGSPEKGKTAGGRKGRKRRPTVRALRAARALKEESASAADSSGTDGPGRVEPGAPNGRAPQAAALPTAGPLLPEGPCGPPDASA